MSQSGKKPPRAPPGCDNEALVSMVSGMITFTQAANSFIRQNESNKEKASCQKELEQLLLNLNQKLLEICACSDDKDDKVAVSSKASSKSKEPPCDKECPCSCQSPQQGKDKSQLNVEVICGCSGNKPPPTAACKNLQPLKCNNQTESTSQSPKNKSKRSATASSQSNNCKKGEACLQKSCNICNPPGEKKSIQNEKLDDMKKQDSCPESCTGIKKKVSISEPGKGEEVSSNKSNEAVTADADGEACTPVNNEDNQEQEGESPDEVKNEDEEVQEDTEEENIMNLDTSGKVDECECTDQEDIVSSTSCACQPEIIQCEIDSPYKKLAMLRELKMKLNEAERNLADLQSEIKRFGRSVSSEKEACRSPIYSAKLYKQIMKATTSIENIVQDTSPYMRKVTQSEQYRLLPSADVDRRMMAHPARKEATRPRNNSSAKKSPVCVQDSSHSRTPPPQFYTVCGQPSGTVYVDCRGVSQDGLQAEESYQDTMDDLDQGCFNPQQCKR